MKLPSQNHALVRLKQIRDDHRSAVTEGYEHRAKSCLTCKTPGACCLDAHFVNVNISRIEAVAISRTLDGLAPEQRDETYARIDAAISKYQLTKTGDTFEQKYACPLYEKGVGCLVHNTAKPLACITHACYENAADLPPDELQSEQELRIDKLNARTYGRRQLSLPIPLAIDAVR